MPKLYQIPQKSKIIAEVSDGSKYFIFYHIDGAFSYCESEKGGVCHLSANQELELLPNGDYKLKE